MWQPARRLTRDMRIAVIGTGKIGGTLGGKWRAAGYDVVFGARIARDSGPDGAPVQKVDQAVDGADVVALAVPGKAVADVIASIGPALAGKVVIDAANRMGEPEVNSKAAVTPAPHTAHYRPIGKALRWPTSAAP